MKLTKRPGDTAMTIIFLGIIICYIILGYVLPTKVEEKIEENHKEALIKM